MKRYKYSYHTVVTYDMAVTHHHFLLRCKVTPFRGQRIIEEYFNLLTSSFVSEAEDSFGNNIQYGYMIDKHDIFVVSSGGVVECDKYGAMDVAPSPIYLTPTPLTTPNSEILEFGLAVSAQKSKLEQSIELANLIHLNFEYKAGVTTHKTTVAECFEKKRGVCQDFSHLLIALCRERGIYSRYVMGFVEGTGETHAWVEVFSDGYWHGIDPTYNKVIEYGYIKVAHGRDAADCSATRGVFRGDVNHATQIRVTVTELAQ